MTIRDFYNQIRVITRKIEQREEQLLKLRQAALRLGAPLNPNKVQSSGGDGLEDKVARIVEIEREIKELIAEMEEARHKIIKSIHQLKDGRYIDVLYKTYVEQKSTRRIAKELNYSEEYVRQLRRKALLQSKKMSQNIVF